MEVTKAQFRQELANKRNSFDEISRAAASKVIINKLRTITDWSVVSTLHCFEPIARLNEVNIRPFIDILQTYPNTNLYTSRKVRDTWQIVDSQGAMPKPIPQFNVVIVPMLGFDRNLQRLGYGGGYYDRFLATQPGAYKIGVCFECGKIEHLPHETHDIPMDVIVTEQRIYHA